MDSTVKEVISSTSDNNNEINIQSDECYEQSGSNQKDVSNTEDLEAQYVIENLQDNLVLIESNVKVKTEWLENFDYVEPRIMIETSQDTQLASDPLSFKKEIVVQSEADAPAYDTPEEVVADQVNLPSFLECWVLLDKNEVQSYFNPKTKCYSSTPISKTCDTSACEGELPVCGGTQCNVESTQSKSNSTSETVKSSTTMHKQKLNPNTTLKLLTTHKYPTRSQEKIKNDKKMLAIIEKRKYKKLAKKGKQKYKKIKANVDISKTDIIKPRKYKIKSKENETEKKTPGVTTRSKTHISTNTQLISEKNQIVKPLSSSPLSIKEINLAKVSDTEKNQVKNSCEKNANVSQNKEKEPTIVQNNSSRIEVQNKSQLNECPEVEIVENEVGKCTEKSLPEAACEPTARISISFQDIVQFEESITEIQPPQVEEISESHERVHNAIKQRNFTEIQKLIKNGEKLCTKKGNNCFIIAAETKSWHTILELLYLNKSGINAIDNNNKSLFYYYKQHCNEGNSNILLQLLQFKFNSNCRDIEEILCNAVTCNEPTQFGDIIEILEIIYSINFSSFFLDEINCNYYDVNFSKLGSKLLKCEPNLFKKIILCFNVRFIKIAIVCLITTGANVSELDSNGCSIICSAIQRYIQKPDNGSLELISLLVELPSFCRKEFESECKYGFLPQELLLNNLHVVSPIARFNILLTILLSDCKCFDLVKIKTAMDNIRI